MKILSIGLAALAATTALASTAGAATIVATLTGGAPYGGAYLNFGPSGKTGLGLTSTGKEKLTFTAGIGPLVAMDIITGFSSTPASSVGGVLTQGGFTGNFKEVYYGTSPKSVTVDGVTLVRGVTVLLSGSFTDGVVGTNGQNGYFEFKIPSYSTPFSGLNLTHGEFSDTFTVTHNTPSILKSGFLHSFQGNSQDGTYFGAVPEPAAWALMLVGFGGVGAALRRRKAIAAT